MTQEMMIKKLDELRDKINEWETKNLEEKYPDDFFARLCTLNADPTPYDEEYTALTHEYFTTYGEPYNPHHDTWNYIESGDDI